MSHHDDPPDSFAAQPLADLQRLGTPGWSAGTALGGEGRKLRSPAHDRLRFSSGKGLSLVRPDEDVPGPGVLLPAPHAPGPFGKDLSFSRTDQLSVTVTGSRFTVRTGNRAHAAQKSPAAVSI